MSVRKVHVRAACVTLALLGAMAATSQNAAAGPIVPPPAKTATSCYGTNGPIVPPPAKTSVCQSTNGPIVPPPKI